MKPLIVPPEIQSVDIEKLMKEQKEDMKLWKTADEKKTIASKGIGKYRMEVNNGILYRVYMQPRADTCLETKQVVVPSKFRKQIMSLAHKSIVGGHMGTKKNC